MNLEVARVTDLRRRLLEEGGGRIAARAIELAGPYGPKSPCGSRRPVQEVAPRRNRQSLTGPMLVVDFWNKAAEGYPSSSQYP